MFTDVVAVVSEEDHDGVRGLTTLLQRVEHLADLRVHVADVGEVTVTHLCDLLVAQRLLLLRRAEDLRALVEGDVRRSGRARGV